MPTVADVDRPPPPARRRARALRRAGRRRQSRSDRRGGPRGLAVRADRDRNRGAIAALAQAEITGAPGRVPDDARTGRRVGGERRRVRVARSRAARRVHRQHAASASRARSSISGSITRALLAPVTKCSATLHPAQIDESDGHARSRRAIGPPPGPVHLDCPGDVAGAPSADAEVRCRARRTCGSPA